MIKEPTIQDIYLDISNDLKSKLGLPDTDLKMGLDAIAMVLAGQTKLMYRRLVDIQNNTFADKAETFENGGTLERLGLIELGRNIRRATSGTYSISLTGEAGSVVRSGITFKSNDDSLNPAKIFISDSEYTLTGSNDNINIRSLEGGGESSLDIGDNLTITEPVIGVDFQTEVTGVIIEPLSEESVEDYRLAILESKQLEPQGGAKTDYKLWAKDAQGVKLVYPYVKDGEPGTVQVYVEATESDSSDGFGTPTQSIINEVFSVIEFDPDTSIIAEHRGRLPIQVNLEVLPIVLNPVDVQVVLLNTNTLEIRNSIEANLKIHIDTIRPFVSGADLEKDKNDIIYLSKIQSVIIDTIDSDNFFSNVFLSVNGVTYNSFQFSRENIPYLRNLTFLGQ